MWDQPEVHEVYRRWHKILAEYDGDRMAVAEAWTGTAESMARYIRPDELQQTFNFAWLQADWSAEAFRKVVVDTFEAVALVDGTPTWVLANHDVVRETTRYGGGATGVARARAAALTMMALPGSAYVYQGEELGLEQVDVAPEHRRTRPGSAPASPAATAAGCRCRGPGRPRRTASARRRGSRGCRCRRTGPALTVEAQSGDDASTLTFFRRMLRLRREVTTGLPDDGRGARPPHRAPSRSVAATWSPWSTAAPSRAALPAEAGELLLSSGTDPVDGLLAPDTAAWFRRSS